MIVSDELHHAAQSIIRHGLLSLKKTSLRELCQSQLLPYSGTKAVIVERLMQHYNTCSIEIATKSVTGATEVTVEVRREVYPDA